MFFTYKKKNSQHILDHLRKDNRLLPLCTKDRLIIFLLYINPSFLFEYVVTKYLSLTVL